MLLCKPKFIFWTSTQRLNFHVFSTVSHLPPPLSSLPPISGISQIKQAHARSVVFGLANDGRIMGHLLAFLAVSSSSLPYEYAFSIHQSISHPSVFATNNMIRCCAKEELSCESISLYSHMRRNLVAPNKHTLTFVLQACSNALAICEGIQVQTHVIKLGFAKDVFIRNALIHLYCTHCRVECAKQLFDEVPSSRDIVSWNSMIAGCVRAGQINVADKLFVEMPEKDVISWSAMISGCVQNGQLEKALDCFNEMREQKMRPNEAILVSMLAAASQLGMLEYGKMIHSIADSLKFSMTASLGTALVDMYAKCGCIDESKFLFDRMPQKDKWTWNVMICGLASHGLGQEALALFEKFLTQGFYPVNVTFIGVLNACSRAGLVSEGRRFFKLMTDTYKIIPEMEHYGCMVDLFSRAGFVYDAVEMINRMPAPPDPVLWTTVLGSCKVHGFIELGEEIGNKLIQMDPTHNGHYVQLAGIYARLRKWEDVSKIRRLMADRNSNKIAGWSLIEAGGRVHRFVAGDKEHERCTEIYKMLETIGVRIAAAGYSANVSSVLHDIEEEEKETAIKEHSERLAIAFGLLVTQVGDCIRIIKNLRVCGDCHEVSKIISRVFEREIIVRDGSRFHHFKNGSCSCLDYW
ncbi:pentatricopeptide repeat-containing protein At4g21065-like [Cucurbita maxima]|uniref:Pentatricopeptide repeat-containing protein At4g21065-like n=1 Tax=Cucurbita maxima TaxID=3661 RepID=A0A6J1KYI2_CUCMA|nr:pentatricopeptide repeat-containing protein At4g21065-like [Cucurbita maxima]